MSATTAVLHPFPAVTNLLQVGTWFSVGFFGNLHRRFLFKSPSLPVLHHPPSNHKTATALYIGRVHPPTRCQAGTRLLNPWLPSRLARSSLVSNAGSKGSNILHIIAPRCNLAPRSPLVMLSPPGVSRRTLTPLPTLRTKRTS